MSSCRSRCYDNSGHMVTSDVLVDNVQATRQAIVQCSPCTFPGGSDAQSVNGRINGANINPGTAYWSIDSTYVDIQSVALPYTLAGNAMVPSVCWLAPFDGVVSRLWVRENNAPLDVPETRTYTVFVGRPDVASSVATLLSVQFNSTTLDVTLHDDSHFSVFSRGDVLSLGVLSTNDDSFESTFGVTVTRTST